MPANSSTEILIHRKIRKRKRREEVDESKNKEYTG